MTFFIDLWERIRQITRTLSRTQSHVRQNTTRISRSETRLCELEKKIEERENKEMQPLSPIQTEGQ